MKGIITADVVGSTKIPLEKREILPNTLQELAGELQKFSVLKLEMYRGDSFQVVVDSYEKTVLIAVLLRIGLMRKSPDSEYLIDARMSVGIGEVGFESQSVGQSDGEAFVFSGRAFEKMGKKRLVIQTANTKVNEELTVLVSVLDDLLSDLSLSKSETVFEYLLHPDATQADIAARLRKSQPTINVALRTSKADTMCLILRRVEYVLLNYLKK